MSFYRDNHLKYYFNFGEPEINKGGTIVEDAVQSGSIPSDIVRNPILAEEFISKAKDGSQYRISMFSSVNEIDHFLTIIETLNKCYEMVTDHGDTFIIFLSEPKESEIKPELFDINLLDV